MVTGRKASVYLLPDHLEPGDLQLMCEIQRDNDFIFNDEDAHGGWAGKGPGRTSIGALGLLQDDGIRLFCRRCSAVTRFGLGVSLA